MDDQEKIPNLILRKARCVNVITTLRRLRFEMAEIGMADVHEYRRLMEAVIERVAEIGNGED